MDCTPEIISSSCKPHFGTDHIYASTYATEMKYKWYSRCAAYLQSGGNETFFQIFGPNNTKYKQM
jgi:hypothetical protein